MFRVLHETHCIGKALLQVELGKLQPVLAEKAEKTEKLVRQVANDQEAAQKVMNFLDPMSHHDNIICRNIKSEVMEVFKKPCCFLN